MRTMIDRPTFQETLRYVFEERVPFCRALDRRFRIVRGRAEVGAAAFSVRARN